jgi:hypothetical protein
MRGLFSNVLYQLPIATEIHLQKLKFCTDISRRTKMSVQIGNPANLLTLCHSLIGCLERGLPLGVVMSTIPKRKYKRSDIEANYRNETKTFRCVTKKEDVSI